ncbi:MAG: hypothetical protein V1894_04050 [Chloroflexota bacterium]
MRPVEVMALLLAAVVIIKLVVILISPESWLNAIPKRLLGHPTLMSLLALALAVVILIFLLGELTIVQIFAALLFATPLIMMAFAPFAKDVTLEDNIFLGRKVLKKAWLASLVWLILAVWVLYSLFV